MTRIFITLVVLAAIGGAGWYFTRPQPIAVTLHEVARGPVSATVSNTRVGTVKACRRAKLAPATGGQVAVISVTEGDAVEEGAILLEIWNEDLKAELRYREADVMAARARAEEACSTAAGAQREAERLRRLSKDKVVSENALDIAVTESESRRAGCRAALANTQISAARTEVARRTIERTILRAPFSGTAAEVNAELGEYITPSPPGIATLPAVDLLDDSCIFISAPIDEVDAPAIRTGMPACVSLDAFPDRRCGAKVRRIAPYVLEREKQARTVEVEVDFSDDASAAGLLPGYSADIEVMIEEHPDVIRVPTETLLDGPSVLVYDPGTGRLAERDVTIGLKNWEFTEIAHGLTVADMIVLSVGRDGVEAGANVVPESPTDE